MLKNTLLFLVLLSAFSIQSAANPKLDPDAHIRFELPINRVSSPKYNLEVSIPPGFISLQPFEAWSDEKITFIEFVPKGEDGENWTEIITINKHIGKKISADILLDLTKKGLLSNEENGNTLKEEVSKQPSYTQAKLTLSYDYKGKHEIVGFLYYSGPYDCVGVQYTIRPQGSNLAAVSKIENFFNKATKITPN